MFECLINRSANILIEYHDILVFLPLLQVNEEGLRVPSE